VINRFHNNTDKSRAKNLFLISKSSQHTKYVRTGASQQANKTGPHDVTLEFRTQKLPNFQDQIEINTRKQIQSTLTNVKHYANIFFKQTTLMKINIFNPIAQ